MMTGEEEEITNAAYAMQAAYIESGDRETAVLAVIKKYPDFDESILEAMWSAIDAFVDLNTDASDF